MKITNHSHLPEAIVRAVVNDPYPYGRTGDISVTRLFDSPRIRLLSLRHWDEIEEDVSERIWALLGQAVHTILERAETQALTEHRLFDEIAGWKLSGQFDRLAYYAERGLLQDYKVTSAWSVIDGPKPDWVAQLNALRYLAARNGYRVEGLEVVAILRDWSRGKARAGGNYPSQPVLTLPIPVTPLELTEAHICGRILYHRLSQNHAERGEPLPECAPAERWQRPTVYAVRKPGRQSAVRLFDDQQKAERLAATLSGGYIETRPGAAVRCADYCPVRAFCDQWAREQTTSASTEEQAA